MVADPPYTSPPANDANPNNQDECIPERDVRDVLALAGLTSKQIDFALASLSSGVIKDAYRQIPLHQQPVQVRPAPAGATPAQLLQHAFDTFGREVSVRALEQAADAARSVLKDVQPEPDPPPEISPAADQAEPSPLSNPAPGEPGWSALLHGVPPSKRWLEERQTSTEVETQRRAAEQVQGEAEELEHATADPATDANAAAPGSDAAQKQQVPTKSKPAVKVKAKQRPREVHTLSEIQPWYLDHLVDVGADPDADPPVKPPSLRADRLALLEVHKVHKNGWLTTLRNARKAIWGERISQK